VNENYFNYFTEIEEHFRQTRGSGMFLLSPPDWALIEAWKGAGIPLEAVLRGIDAAFEKWRARPARARTQMVNSLAYCAQAVTKQAQEMSSASPRKAASQAPFTLDEVIAYVERNASQLAEKSLPELAASLRALDLPVLYSDLEQLEQRLSALEEKLIAQLRTQAREETLFEARRSLDQELKPYRSKMSAEQLSMLERQFLERKLLEMHGVPRLSLFYLQP